MKDLKYMIGIPLLLCLISALFSVPVFFNSSFLNASQFLITSGLNFVDPLDILKDIGFLLFLYSAIILAFNHLENRPSKMTRM